MALTKITNQSLVGITSLPSAVSTDLTPVRQDVLTLALKQAVQENSTKFNLPNSAIVKFEADADFNLAGSTNITLEGAETAATNEIEYKSEGESIVNLSKVSDNFVKFSIAKPKGDNLESISLVNAEDIILIIKSGAVEQQIHHDPNFPDIDLGKGEVLFKVTKSIATRFDQPDTNNAADKFYINLKNGQTESLLYHGKVNII